MSHDDRKRRIQEVERRLSCSNEFIPYGHQSISEEDIAAVATVLRSPFITTGPMAARFEAALCELTGARHAIVCSNGTTALHLACLGLGITNDDLGITSPITFLASANCLEFCGGRADFVDIDPENLCLSPDKLEAYCRNVAVPRVVIPVDFAGIPADLPAIHALSKKYGFRTIEDAAHAIGSTYEWRGRRINCGACVHSDLAVFSFHPVKTITCGEGGAVLTNDDRVAEQIRLLRSHGIQRLPDLLSKNNGPWYYEMTALSNNYRITDFQCALGNSQLKRLQSFKTRRREIVDRYNNAFSAFDNLMLPPAPKGTAACYHLYTLQFHDGFQKRHEVFQKLSKARVSCQIHYIPVYWQRYYKAKYGYAMGKCPNAEKYYAQCLSLPLYPALSDDEVDYVIELVSDCLR